MTQKIQNLNLAREFISRLQNTCYNHTTIQVINQMAQNTNYEKKVYYGGQLQLLKQMHMGRSTLNRHIRLLRSDGLIVTQYNNGQTFSANLRQQYKLVLPPAGLKTCADWFEHANNSFHRDSYGDLLTRLAEFEAEEKRLADRAAIHERDSLEDLSFGEMPADFMAFSEKLNTIYP